MLPDSDFPGEETHEVWPSLADLLAASAMIFLVLLGVVLYQRAVDAGTLTTFRRELLAALNSVPEAQRKLFQIDSGSQFVRIVLQEDVTFPTARYEFADLKPEGRKALGEIGKILGRRDIDTLYQLVEVVGHTDQVRIYNPRFTNWELSAMRAAAVVRLLVHYVGVDPCRITASGAGPYFPRRVPPDLPNLAENRRIEILILPARPSDRAGHDRCYLRGDSTPIPGRVQ